MLYANYRIFHRKGLLLLLVLILSAMGHVSGRTLSDGLQPVQGAAVAQPSEDGQGNPLDLKLAQTVAVGDFNGDRLADVAVADFFRNVVYVMVRDADGRFTTAASLAAGHGPRSIVATDFNHDGAVDIAVASFFSGDVRVFLGTGSAQFHEAGTIQLERGVASLSATAGNAGEAAGLTVANFLTGAVSMLKTSAAGTLERAESIGSAPGTTFVLNRDVTGDGLADVIAVDATGQSVRLFAAQLDGSFEDRGRVDMATVSDHLHPDSPSGSGISVRAVAGDGQTALTGSPLPEAVVIELRDVGGDPLPGSAVLFSALAGFRNVSESAQWTDEDGQAALQLAAADVPQNQFVGATVPSGATLVAGSLSALSNSGFRQAIHQAAGADPRDAAALALIDATLDGATPGEEVETIVTLLPLIDAAGNQNVSDLLTRLVNQVLLIGIDSPGPDLVETAVSEPPAIVTLKDKFVASDTVSNQGTGAASISTTRYYLSLDGVQKTSRLGGGGRSVPALNPGASSSGSDTVAVAASAKPGFYFLLACADDQSAILEDNETNNCRASTGQVQVKAADLIVTAVSEPPASAAEGSSITVSDTTMNNGDFAAAKSTTSYYLSLDQKKSSGDFLVASRVVGPLAAGASSTGSVSATVSASPNSYFLIACADALKKVPEGNAAKTGEKNNCLSSTGKITVTPAVADGGPLVNGALATGRISAAGEVDEWTFSANAGDRITVHVGEIVDDNDFRPWLRLLSPSDASLGEASGISATVIDDIVAPATGTYKVRVASFDSGFDGTGSYRLTIVHTPGPITVSAGDQGGPLTNGAIHEGEITQGDVDVWTFTATAGDRITIHTGEIADTDDFRPWLRLWAPNGASLGDLAGVSATVIDDVVAPVTGTYLVLVATFDSGFDGEGTYRLTMMHTPGPITVSAGDQGGPLTNGAIHLGEILQGDVDVWTFTANAGERIAVHIGEIADTDDFRPWLRLWAPNGASLGDVAGVSATVIDDIVAPVTGTYFVLVATFDSGFDGEGTYRLTMTHTPGPITVSPGDQGGPLTNGAIHEGEITQGDVDVWTFTANAGDRITLHIGEIADTDDFRPWLRLWAPNGATLGDVAGVSATVIDDIVAPVTGTYLVLVATFDSGFDGEGTYRLTMMHTPGPIAVSPGDQGGPLTNGAIHEGEITQGDVDVWTFTATAGDRIALHIGEIADTDDFRPWIRLWAPTGATLGDVAGVAATVMDDVIAPVTGTYFVLVASFDSGFDGEGTYRLTMTHTPGPIAVSPGDQGGPMTLGVTHTGEILQGDVDVWTITLNAGDHITIDVAETSDPNDFRPWIRLWAPNGATLGDVAGLTSAQITSAVAPVTGTYLVLVGTFDSGFDGTGTYSLTAGGSVP